MCNRVTLSQGCVETNFQSKINENYIWLQKRLQQTILFHSHGWEVKVESSWRRFTGCVITRHKWSFWLCSTWFFVGQIRIRQVYMWHIKCWKINFQIEHIPAGLYLLKVNNRNTRTRCKLCSNLTWRLQNDAFVDFEHILHLVLLFLLLTLNI